MFGYVRAYKPELRMKEYELYKAVYCSFCKELGKSYGFLSRFTLSYDFTFLGLLNMALNDKCSDICRKSCTCNPLKKCNYLTDMSDLELPGAAAMILIYYKLKDNIKDEKGFKKLGYILTKPLFSSAHKKASKAYPEIENMVAEFIENQNKIETENSENIDMAAEPTAVCMKKLFMLLSEEEADKRCLGQIGYCIGRYVYILDALIDLEEDIKKKRYNPLKNFGGDIKEFAEFSLNICIAEMAKAYELLDIKKFKNILDNIIYLGLQDTFKKELKI